MLYMLLIYANEREWAGYSEAEQAAVMRGHDRLEADLRQVGKYRGCGALEPTGSATTVRVRGGKTMVTDGPFAETKEHLAASIWSTPKTSTMPWRSRPASRR